ncbi:MAG: hypothetical protein HQK67_02725, partial [Desulfamplus sp.]|nr:hypothetical protein [Desulfamplus sp.]
QGRGEIDTLLYARSDTIVLSTRYVASLERSMSPREIFNPSFLYWIVYGFATSLGYARILPPFISAWATNFIFLCISIIYLLNTE